MNVFRRLLRLTNARAMTLTMPLEPSRTRFWTLERMTPYQTTPENVSGSVRCECGYVAWAFDYWLEHRAYCPDATKGENDAQSA